jgi:taspase, threonine aspartase, 1
VYGFLEPSELLGNSHPNVGVLILVVDENVATTKAKLWCAFTTPSMSIAYASSEESHPKVIFLPKEIHIYFGLI